MKIALCLVAIIAWTTLLGACSILSPASSFMLTVSFLANDQPKLAADAKQSVAVEVAGHIGGPGLSVLVRGDYAYLALASELAVVDVSHPQRPQRVGYALIPARQLAA